MNKFITYLFLLTLVLIVIAYLSSHPGVVDIQMGGYEVQVSLNFAIGSAIALLFTVTLLARIVIFILNIPLLIKTKILNISKGQVIHQILKACNMAFTGDNLAAIELVKKIKATDNPDVIQCKNILISKISDNTEERLHYLTELLKDRTLRFYASKELAKLYFAFNNFNKALMYYSDTADIYENDKELLMLALQIYDNLNLWGKYNYVLEKLDRHYPEYIEKFSKEISEAFLKAARFSLKEANDSQVIYYLERSLTYNPINLESIILISEIYINHNKKDALSIIIESAFSLEPSYDLFKLYLSITSMSNLEIFQKLSSLVDLNSYLELFIKIAIKLELEDQVQMLRQQILLS